MRRLDGPPLSMPRHGLASPQRGICVPDQIIASDVTATDRSSGAVILPVSPGRPCCACNAATSAAVCASLCFTSTRYRGSRDFYTIVHFRPPTKRRAIEPRKFISASRFAWPHRPPPRPVRRRPIQPRKAAIPPRPPPWRTCPRRHPRQRLRHCLPWPCGGCRSCPTPRSSFRASPPSNIRSPAFRRNWRAPHR